jgi:hypothetical protein
MGLRLWLDDRRRPPPGYDLWAKTAREAIAMLERHEIDHCSLDHDLADEHYDTVLSAYGEIVPGRTAIDRAMFVELTGYAVLEWMHEHDRWVADISIHTLNDLGGLDMMVKLRTCAPSRVDFRRVFPDEP